MIKKVKKWPYFLWGFVLMAFIAIYANAASNNADSESYNSNILGFGEVGSNGEPKVWFSSSGHMVGQGQKTMDVGSPGRLVRNAYISTATVSKGSLEISTDSRVNLGVSFSAYATSAGVTVPYLTSFMVLTTTGDGINFTARPQISTGTPRDGDTLTVMNSSTNTIRFTDRNNIVSTGVKLSSANHILGPWDSISFIYNASTVCWIETNKVDNLPSP